MHIQIDTNVYLGDHKAPVELKKTVNTIINVAHAFSRRRGRNIYFANLEQIPWRTLYFRLAKKDHDEVDEPYFDAFESFVEQAVKLDKLPILCHCQMGAHRGPTSAIAAAWILNGRTKESLEHFIDKTTKLRPRYARSINTPYRKTMTEIMLSRSV